MEKRPRAPRAITPVPCAMPRPKDPIGFHPIVPTDRVTRRSTTRRIAPGTPKAVTRKGPASSPHRPTVSLSWPRIPRPMGTINSRPPIRIERRVAHLTEIQSLAPRPPRRRRPGKKNAAIPTSAVSARRTDSPTTPITFPDGNHSTPLGPSTDTGTRAARRKSPNANKPATTMSRCCF